MGSNSNITPATEANAKKNSRRTANLGRCVVCYRSDDIKAGAGIGVLMKSLVAVSRSALGIRIDSGLAKGGLVIMCAGCHAEYKQLENGITQDQIKPANEASARFAFKIVKSVIDSDYVCNGKVGDPFDVFRYVVYKGWRRSFKQDKKAKDDEIGPSATKSAESNSTTSSENVTRDIHFKKSTESLTRNDRLTTIRNARPRPRVPYRKVVFVKRDPKTGAMIKVPTPSQTVIRGKCNGRNIVITPRVNNISPVPNQKHPEESPSDGPLDATRFVSTELNEYPDEPDATATSTSPNDYIPHQLDGTDIFIDEESNDGISGLEITCVDDLQKSNASPTSTGSSLSKVDYEEVRSQRSGRRINRRVYDSSNWVTGTRLDQLMRSEKTSKPNSPPKRAKIGNFV